MSNFQQRLVLSTAFFLVLAFAITFSTSPLFRPIFTLLVLAVVGSALWEYYRISREKNIEPLVGVGIVGSSLYLYTLFLSTQYAAFANLPQMVLLLTLFAAFLTALINRKNPLVTLSTTLFGLCYLTLPLATLIPINFVFGRFWLVYLLVVTKMTDMGGYFAGKILGKNKFVPSISPKKTWEGAVGGFLSSIIASVMLFWGFTDFPIIYGVALGALLSILAQFGDLAESLLKRDCGVKDSSHLPGLGGMLDIVDSLVFTAPTLYFLLQMKN